MSTTSTPSSVPVQEGTIPFAVGGDTLATWYKVVGDLDGRKTRPLVVLHGGPGFSHDYLLPLADLAVDRPVIFYDQVGSGRSSTAVDKPQTFWTFDLFIDELTNLLRRFQIESDFDVLGHSWGGMLLCEYILRRKPAGLKHAVWSNAPASAASMTQSRIQQVLELPQWVQDEVKKGWRNDPEFRKALQVFSVKHHCRLEPQPAEFRKCIDYGFANDHVLRGLDANEGTEQRWTVVGRLQQITVPALLVNGRYDTAQDWVVEPFFKELPRVKWVRFDSEGSSHTPMWEDRERYMQFLKEFLSE